MAELPWDELREMTFPALSRAVEEIKERHTRTAPPIEGREGAIERLRALLDETPWDRLERIPERLRRRDLDLIPDLLALESEERIAAKAVEVGLLVSSAWSIRRAWELAVTRGECAGLSKLLQGFSRDLGLMREIGPDSTTTARLQAWLSQPAIAAGILGDIELSPRPLDDWLAELPELSTPIAMDSALALQLRAELLTTGSRALLRAHPPEQLQAWAGDLGSIVQESFSIQYLVQLREERAWDRDLGDWISGRLGEPDFGHLKGPWRRLEERSPGCAKDFASWRAIQRLEKFFESVNDPHGRFGFWRDGFGEDLVDARIVAGGEAALLHLPPLVVVEFGNVGFAAYVYPASEWQRLCARRTRNARDYQNAARLVASPQTGRPYKINHFEGWTARAYPIIRQLLSRAR